VKTAIEPVGVVRSSRSRIEDDGWDSESSRIELLPPFGERALRGLDQFSHCVVVYLFDRADWDPTLMTRRPRGNPDWPEVGVFAQRNKDRPNRLGVTICRVVSVNGPVLEVAGLDAIDGTPVLDVKPHMIEFGPRGDVRQPDWAVELMRDYW
jgi:tRNA-Thr(GGU) m(6)t(6)A37 methyltransferase TsaA